jgi:hypothetical protein
MLVSFLISTLTSRYKAADAASFRADHPEPWLVWEPGPWRPGGQGQTGFLPAVGRSANPAPVPTAAEALATQLKVDERHPQVTVGRAEDASIPINDATLSRVHLVLSRGATAWVVEDSQSSNGSWLAGQKLEPGKRYPLQDGAQLQAGQVFLTFYEPGGMYARIKVNR